MENKTPSAPKITLAALWSPDSANSALFTNRLHLRASSQSEADDTMTFSVVRGTAAQTFS